MNVILTRTAQNHGNITWEPFATSTPLKIVPNNVKISDLLQKQLLSDSDIILRKPAKQLTASAIHGSKLTDSKLSVTPKKVKRNKSSAHFDLSSSSDDDDSGESKRPIIKVGSKKTRLLSSVKKVESEETANVGNNERNTVVQLKGKKGRPVNEKKAKNGNGNSGKVKKVESEETVVVNVGNNEGNTVVHLKGKKGRPVKDKTANNGNADVSSDEDCKIFDESNANKNTATCIKPGLQTVENDNLKTSEKEQTELAKVLQKGTNKASKQNKLPKATTNNKLPTLLKRKGTNTSGPAKKSSKSSKPPEETVKSAVTPIKLWAHKSNLSHQLFSDSREQEIINTLDLTKDEVNEPTGISCSLWNKPKTTPSKEVTSTNPDACEENEPTRNQTRPGRKRQKPKEYWLPESASPTSTADKETHSTRKGSRRQTKVQPVANVVTEEIKENDEREKAIGNGGVKRVKKTKRRRRNVLKEKDSNAHDDEVVVSSTNENQVQNEEIHNELKSSGTGADVKTDGAVGLAGAEENAVTSDPTVFKLFRELSFTEDERGCAVVQCQSTNNFKCGVLKLKAQSEFKFKTLHSNSRMGGVVVKGIIGMKIGEKESELREGDMAFVPPLTEWKATNVGDSESVFYYWCSRFK